MTDRIKPMLANLVEKPFDDKDWVFETKWDGFRIISEIKDGKVTLYTRNSNVVTDKYEQIVKDLKEIKHDALLDGELVALDDSGRSRFQLLQNAINKKAGLHYYVFDIMFLDGKDIRQLPLIERKELLQKIIPHNNSIKISEHRTNFGTKYFKEAKESDEEGIMAKRAESTYQSGVRSHDWLKIKNHLQQEFVIVGFTEPQHSRKYFGSLVLGIFDKGRLRYVGHVGTGFDDEELKIIHSKLFDLKIDKKPFDVEIENEKNITWVEPKIVCEVKFTEWTTDGELRHPAFLGIRDDKSAREVVREIGLK